jgi:hypothetical protein
MIVAQHDSRLGFVQTIPKVNQHLMTGITDSRPDRIETEVASEPLPFFKIAFFTAKSRLSIRVLQGISWCGLEWMRVRGG